MLHLFILDFDNIRYTMSNNSMLKDENKPEEKIVSLNQDIGYLLIKYLEGSDVINFMEVVNGSEAFSTIEIKEDYVFYKIFMRFFAKENVKLNIPNIEQDLETWTMGTTDYAYPEWFYQEDAPELHLFIRSTFTVEAFKSMCHTYKTESFQCYCRLLSLNMYAYVGDLLLIDYFYHIRSIGCSRELNTHERSLFKGMSCS